MVLPPGLYGTGAGGRRGRARLRGGLSGISPFRRPPGQGACPESGSVYPGPGDQGWACLLEEVWGAKIIPWTRYATEKDPSSFCRAKLEGYAGPPTGFELRPMDGALYTQAMKEDWSRDLCALFEDGLDYEARGIGVAVLCGGELVAGASSYAVYRDGIEIEIDTRPDQRGKGLATACGARLILDCLDRGLYPSWDAHDKRSAHLAQKLGYRLAGAYRAYLNMERPAPGLPVP